MRKRDVVRHAAYTPRRSACGSVGQLAHGRADTLRCGSYPSKKEPFPVNDNVAPIAILGGVLTTRNLFSKTSRALRKELEFAHSPLFKLLCPKWAHEPHALDSQSWELADWCS